jgi:hypothetical protein
MDGLKQCSSLINHPRNNEVKFDYQKKSFLVYHSKNEWCFYPGIHNFMKSLFFPGVDNKKNYRASVPFVKRPDPSNREAYEEWNKYYSGPSGIEGGIMVHNDVTRAFNTFSKVADHPQSKMIFAELGKVGYRPIVGDFRLFDEKLGYATAVDGIVADPALDRIVVIELKTGQGGYWTTSSGLMKGPAAKFLKSNSIQNQALLQIILITLTLFDRYNLIVWPEVWRVDDTGVYRTKFMNNTLTRQVRRQLYDKIFRFVSQSNEHPVEKKRKRAQK